MHHILSYSKYGVDKINKVSQQKLLHYFSQIRTSGKRLLSHLNDLLDLSKLEAGRMGYVMKKTDLGLMIEGLISDFSFASEEKAIRFKLQKPLFSTVVYCDEMRIYQVLHNLLSNAVKFTGNGKCVVISFVSVPLPNQTIQSQTSHIPAIEVRIKDEGIGIQDNELETIFDKFIQSSKTKTGAGGTGLGLSISREIVKAHHGEIWAENNPDEGATFCFRLPYQQPL